MTTTNADLPIVRVSGPADLVQTIPYLLGFHPARSLVLVGLADRRVVVTARMDLDELADGRLLPTTVAGLYRGGAERLVAVVYDDQASAGRGADLPWTNVAAEIDDLADELGLAVDDVALVSGARLWSLVCGNPACCPPEGRSISGTSAAVAAATYAGLVALPDRASVAALLDPAPDDDRQCLGQALYEAESDAVAAVLRGDEARRHRSTVRALFATARALDEAGADGVLDDATLVRFGAALQSIPLRDSAWIAVDCERVDGRALWRRLGTLLPPPYDAPPLFLFGWASYRRGDGALAGIAAERALQSDPDYSAADLLLSALTQAIDPRRLPRLRGSSSARAGGRPTLAGPAARGGRRGGQPGAGGPKRR